MTAATPHLQDQHQDCWITATDEAIIAALFDPPPFVNPCWMAYLKRHRASALCTYLGLFAADDGTLGPAARRFLGEGR